MRWGLLVSDAIEWVAVDWGTSNLRAWGMSVAGAPISSATSDKGMGKLERGQYPQALQDVVRELGVEDGRHLDVLVCGMAGARQGWIEAPYLEAPTDLRGLAQSSVRPDVPGSTLSVSILPGVCQKRGGENVMRGEETQLLGLASTQQGYEGLVCMPGTHSKWAYLRDTHIGQFSTAMTGEVFEVLRTHSVLRHSLTGENDGAARDAGFGTGASDGLARPQDLLGQLFRVRAASLLSGRDSSWCAGYLSGLLIGTEVAAHLDDIGEAAVPLIGSTSLCALYARVLSMAGKDGRPVDATSVAIAGLSAARQQLA